MVSLHDASECRGKAIAIVYIASWCQTTSIWLSTGLPCCSPRSGFLFHLTHLSFFTLSPLPNPSLTFPSIPWVRLDPSPLAHAPPTNSHQLMFGFSSTLRLGFTSTQTTQTTTALALMRATATLTILEAAAVPRPLHRIGNTLTYIVDFSPLSQARGVHVCLHM